MTECEIEEFGIVERIPEYLLGFAADFFGHLRTPAALIVQHDRREPSDGRWAVRLNSLVRGWPFADRYLGFT